MSNFLAKSTGIHISPKRTYVDKKQLGKAALFAAGTLAIPGVGGLIAKGATAIPGIGAGLGAIGSAAKMIPGAGKIASVGKFALDNSDLIMGGLGAAEGMKDDKRSRDLMNQALASQQQRNVMMGQAADRMGQIQRPDLSSLYADPMNPYARKRIPAVGMGA